MLPQYRASQGPSVGLRAQAPDGYRAAAPARPYAGPSTVLNSGGLAKPKPGPFLGAQRPTPGNAPGSAVRGGYQSVAKPAAAAPRGSTGSEADTRSNRFDRPGQDPSRTVPASPGSYEAAMRSDQPREARSYQSNGSSRSGDNGAMELPGRIGAAVAPRPGPTQLQRPILGGAAPPPRPTPAPTDPRRPPAPTGPGASPGRPSLLGPGAGTAQRGLSDYGQPVPRSRSPAGRPATEPNSGSTPGLRPPVLSARGPQPGSAVGGTPGRDTPGNRTPGATGLSPKPRPSPSVSGSGDGQLIRPRLSKPPGLSSLPPSMSTPVNASRHDSPRERINSQPARSPVGPPAGSRPPPPSALAQGADRSRGQKKVLQIGGQEEKTFPQFAAEEAQASEPPAADDDDDGDEKGLFRKPSAFNFDGRGQVYAACPRCGGSYQKEVVPCILNCNHTFCSECMEKLEDNDKISCPRCHKLTDLQGRGVEGLPRNYALTSLAEMDENDLQRNPTFVILESLDATCPICLETYGDDRAPLSLECGHTTCDSCIILLARKAESEHIECPTCSVKFDLSNVTPNLDLKKTVETVRLLRKHAQYRAAKKSNAASL